MIPSASFSLLPPSEKRQYAPLTPSPLNPNTYLDNIRQCHHYHNHPQAPQTPHHHHRPRISRRAATSPHKTSPTQWLLRQKAAAAWHSETFHHQFLSSPHLHPLRPPPPPPHSRAHPLNKPTTAGLTVNSGPYPTTAAAFILSQPKENSVLEQSPENKRWLRWLPQRQPWWRALPSLPNAPLKSRIKADEERAIGMALVANDNNNKRTPAGGYLGLPRYRDDGAVVRFCSVEEEMLRRHGAGSEPPLWWDRRGWGKTDREVGRVVMKGAVLVVAVVIGLGFVRGLLSALGGAGGGVDK